MALSERGTPAASGSGGCLSLDDSAAEEGTLHRQQEPLKIGRLRSLGDYRSQFKRGGADQELAQKDDHRAVIPPT